VLLEDVTAQRGRRPGLGGGHQHMPLGGRVGELIRQNAAEDRRVVEDLDAVALDGVPQSRPGPGLLRFQGGLPSGMPVPPGSLLDRPAKTGED
jgi:hypothetical protein